MLTMGPNLLPFKTLVACRFPEYLGDAAGNLNRFYYLYQKSFLRSVLQ